MRLTVPGNILIAGEYAVVEEGGLGLAAAVDPRLELYTRPAVRLRITGVFGESSTEWPDDGETGLIGRCIGRMRTARPGFSPEKLPVHFFVDSRSLYAGRGRKRGLGSSAAVVVALVAALDLAYRRYIVDSAPEVASLGRLLLDCVSVHRQFQAGRGSGYDVAASLFGGIGLFSGGHEPAWRPAAATWLRELPELRLVEGERAVRTVSALAAYETWKHSDPEAAHRYLSASNAAVAVLAGTPRREKAIAHLRDLKRAAAALGSEIGVPAEVSHAPPPGWICISVGAGNETVICLRESDSSKPAVSPRAPGERLLISDSGIQVVETFEAGA